MSISLKEYFALAGSNFTNDDARVIGPVLQELVHAGQSRPNEIVDAARSTNSPLHEYFEWNDQRAGQLYREGQARDMVQAIRVRVVPREQPKEPRQYKVTVQKTEWNTLSDVTVRNEIDVLDGASLALRALDEWIRVFGTLAQAKEVADILQPILNQISEFKEECRGEIPPNDVVAVFQDLQQIEQACQKLIGLRDYGEQTQYLIEAIDDAWKAYGQLVEDKKARLTVVEQENEELREKIDFLERLFIGDQLMPRQLRLTKQEGKVVGALLNNKTVNREAIHYILYSDKPDADEADIKIVDVLVCKIRPKLDRFGIKIESLWGVGYQMPDDSRKRLQGLIEADKSHPLEEGMI